MTAPTLVLVHGAWYAPEYGAPVRGRLSDIDIASST